MVLAELSFESSSSIEAAIGFVFRLVEGFAAANRGSLEAGGTLLGVGRVGSGGGPCGGGKAPKDDVGCRNRLRCGEA